MAAAAEFGYKRVALAGGVSANSLLRKRMGEECEKAGCAFYVPDVSLCGDNAAMVGVQGFYEMQAGHLAGQDLNAAATKSIEEG